MTERKKLALEVEDLEERIAPSFAFEAGSQPDVAGADPVGGQGDFNESFGPDSAVHPTGEAWTAHQTEPTPLDNGGNA